MGIPIRLLIASAAVAAAAVGPTALAGSIERIDREVSIAVNRADGVFYGHVLSGRPGTCAEGARVYVLQKRHGPDKRLAGTFAAAKGARWHLKLPGQGGHRVYAKVPRLVTRGNAGTTICRGASSAVVAG
jgi:hypothetical protein